MSEERPRVRRRYFLLGGAVVAIGTLLRPAGTPDLAMPSVDTEFRWNADQLFEALEAQFSQVLLQDQIEAAVAVGFLETEGVALLDTIAASESTAHDALQRLADLQFELAVRGAAHASLMPRVLDFFTRARMEVMRAASDWPMDRSTQEALYRVIFGGRIALDEAIVQAGLESVPALVRIEDVPSATPSIEVEGVRIHSGDILLSRGGAPTSALIARGNDFPNTFSHSALVHVDEATGLGTVIESLLEVGAVTGTVEQYLESKKHRILVLRLRPDHPALLADAMLPHRAAESMLARVRSGHIPYDFAMAWDDTAAMFCSEIIHHAYSDLGVELWALRGSMSTPGLVSWLGAMGVREFTTLVPSDLEYDPQVRAVVEWRHAPELMEYRLDNAVTDALIEEADRGSELGYAWYTLPGARLLKGYSLAQSMIGRRATIPEGMSADAALRVDALVSRVNPAVKAELGNRAVTFRVERGYEAPYWELVELAREALAVVRPTLAPALTLEEQ
jgi:hypothetical protein